MDRHILAAERIPVTEPIVAPAGESFLWRCDDYPLPWSRWNTHSAVELHLLRGAEGTAYVGDHIGPFADGDLYLIGANLPHNWLTPTAPGQIIPARDMLIQFEEERLLAAAPSLPELAGLAPLLDRARRGLKFHGTTRKHAAHLMPRIGSARGLSRLAMLLELLALLAASREVTSLSSADFTRSGMARTDAILSEVFAHMNAHATRPLRLGEVAAIAGMTETSFSRFFRSATGNTFSRHLSELRITRACDLLARTDMAVTEVCGAAGYDNLSNFNRSFRTLRGMSPRAFRRLSRQR